jgi:adenylate kinase family enzyme
MNSHSGGASARPRSGLGLVTSVRARGRGIIVLAGPSSCGKGAVAAALRKTLHLPPENHLSMGEALREIVEKSAADPAFRATVGERYGVHADRGIFDAEKTPPAIVQKARQYEGELRARFGAAPTQVDWLSLCVTAGLLVPDAWSERIIEGVIAARAAQDEVLILLDGYPRTEVAARHVLDLSSRLGIGILKVIHLSISKGEMHRRALGRARMDDTEEMLERRYQFYIDHVQPAMETLKANLGSHSVALIDAQQPSYLPDGTLDLEGSVRNVAHAVLVALGVSRHILDHLEEGPPPSA